MNALRFEEPIFLTVGIGMPAEVNSVERAFTILNDWPSWRRTCAYEVALNACRAAIAGEIDAETARTTLAAFARREESGLDVTSTYGMPSYRSGQPSQTISTLRA
jgi:hypothetical protein